MAIVAFCSAKGAPGTTTAAMLTAALWPRPVLLADCDPSGGDIALRLPAQDGSAVDPQRGLLALAPLARRGLTGDTVMAHRQILAGGTELIAGVATADQSRAMGPQWITFASAFDTLPGTDVVADCGRLTALDSPVMPLLHRAAMLVMVLRPTVAGVLHTRERLTALQGALGLGQRQQSRSSVGVLLVAGPEQARDIQGAVASLQRDLPWLTDFGHLVHDPRGASLFEGATVSRPDRTLLVRSGRQVVAPLAAQLQPRAGVVHEAPATETVGPPLSVGQPVLDTSIS